ncbi:GDP-mannose 4,6-dehydratase [Candidatus Micrarchaeota archaeon]|nr:GDP-mannose 4,6-dehydratase [Candidatus Micrarchaeota archaeon]
MLWKGKKVLITGGTGFIGSWLVEALTDREADITLLVKRDDPIGLDSIKHIRKKIKVVYGDVRDSSVINKAMKDMDMIYHLAAITQVMYAIKNPRETSEVDINGTMNILEALRIENNEAFLIFASTDKVYGEPNYVPIDENHVLDAKSPYDASKLAADRLVQSYHTTYGLKTAISRCSNVIGGRDSNILRALPSFVYFLINNKKPIIRTSGGYIRDYMYVEDAVNALIKLGDKQELTNGHVFNFGTGNATSVIQLAELAIKNFGLHYNYEPVVLNKKATGEIEKQYLSWDKADKILNWKPSVHLEEAVKRSVDWYKNNKWWLQVIEKTSYYYGLNINTIYGIN